MRYAIDDLLCSVLWCDKCLINPIALSQRVPFFKKRKIIQHSQTSTKKYCEHLCSLVLKDQDSPVLDDKLDVWPGGASGGLPDAEKLGNGDVEVGQVASLDDEVNVVDEGDRPTPLGVAVGGEGGTALPMGGELLCGQS